MSGTEREKKRFARWQKALALLPLAVVAGAWSTSLGSTQPPAADASQGDPDLPVVPATGFQDPASVTVPPAIPPSVITGDPTGGGRPGDDPTDASADGIPDAAVAAYQRTEAVLAQADPSCHLPWELIAAIGRVESDHGRYGGSVLNDDGVSTPGIYGIPLDGTDGTALINDTDRGSLDDDAVFDRAVGPMQFIPSTWEIVGVDGDGDGERNPQDIDDAALAAGVYLCAGTGDLATDAGRRTAVYSYNNNDDYVDLVLSIMASYAEGDYTTVDNGLPSDNVVPDDGAGDQPKPHKPRHHKPGHQQPDHPGPGPDTGDGDDGTDGDGGNHHPDPGGGGNHHPGGGGDGDGGGDKPDPTKPVHDTVDPVVEATQKCSDAFSAAGIDPTGAQLNQCIAAFQSGGMAAVDNLIDDLLDLLDVPLPDLPVPSLPGLPGQH